MVSERNRARMHLVLIVMPALLSGLRGPVVQPLYAADFQPRELLTNGNFETGDKQPKEWNIGRGVSWEKEGGNHYLHLSVAKPGDSATSSRSLRLEPDWGFLRVSGRVRYRNIVQGREGWHDGRIAMTFKDAKGQRVGPWPPVLHWTGSCEGWKQESKDFFIPEGAVSLDITLALFSVQSGEIDFDDLSVLVIKARPKLEDAPAPAEVGARMWESSTATRGQLCLNGCWRFRPIGLGDDISALKPEMLKAPPPIPKSPGWGWLKAPSCWPGFGREAHVPVAPEIWEAKVNWPNVEATWYQRKITVPDGWQGRRVFLHLDMPQTQASVFVADKPLGAIRWPGGRLDVSEFLRAGQTATLTLFVTALPFEAEKLVAMREDMIFKAKSEIRFRGLCGDGFLESEPSGPHIASVQFHPSVRKRQLGLHINFAGMEDAGRYTIAVETLLGGNREKQWSSSPFQGDRAKDGLTLTMPWMAKQLWDLDQANLYDVRLQLRRAGEDAVLDERIERLGFREVWLEGRNVMLNGTPVHWRALDFSNHVANAGAASYKACRETFRRMRSLGFNFAILANYGFDPGETLTFEDLLRAADHEGFLLSFSTPHPLRSLSGWDAKRGLSEEWRRLADYCVAKAQNHPCVLAYAMSHNTLGYSGDQNPAKMDGKYLPKPSSEKAARDFFSKRKVAAAAEAYVRTLDPTRLVYHHQSGHMGDWHTVNIYLCWAPMQERMEWLSHWAKEGVKPLFFVEWGLPHIASWGSHRLGPFIWRNKVNSEPWAIEFGAAITGDAAYNLTDEEEKHIDNYEKVYARGEPFHISQVLGDYWANAREHNMVEIQSDFTRHVWPAFRTWGLSAVLPWDQGDIARKKGAPPERMEVRPFDRAQGRPEFVEGRQDPNEINSPGIHPDFLLNRGDYFQFADGSALEVSSLGETFRRVNADFFAYIAGDKARFTEQGHIFRPGEWVRKQVVIINDRRVRCAGRFEWTALLGEKELGGAADEFEVEAGTVKKWTIVAKVPPATEESGTIKLVVRPNDGGVVQDVFSFSVVQKPVAVEGEVAIIDPVGKTLGDLKRLGIHARKVKTPPADCHSLVIGRQALTPAGEFPDIAPILTSGGTVLVMEQDEAVLSQRLGLRTNIPSLRRVFTRVPDHPVLAGLSAELLRDWRGEATLIPKQYDLPKWEESYPMVDWLGFKNTRAWKWRNQGQVASVVIEKLQYGDFLPILDGGFDEKYTALMEARVGAGRIIFCQMDVSGRTEPDPAADLLLSNLVRYTLSAPPPPPATRAWCGNAEATRKLLSNLRAVMSCANQPSASDVVVAGRDFKDTSLLRRHAESGGTVVMLDAGAEALKSVLPSSATTKEERLTHTPPPLLSSPVWRGVGPCDLHWRGRTVVNTVHLQAGASEAVSTGVLAVARVGKGKVITSAVTPDRFDYTAPNKIYLKLTCQHSAFLVSRLLANQGVSFEAPLLANWSKPVMPTMSLLAGWKGTTDPKETITPATVCLPEFDATAWKPIVVPGEWEKQSPDWANYDGIFWYRLSFEVPAALTAEDSELVLGAIDDEDWTYLNGKLLGHIGQDTNPKDYWSAPRVYPLPAGTLKAGQNILAIKVRDLRQAGGLMTGPVEIRIPARWLKSYYLDAPIALDDPYRYNRW